MLPPRKTLPGNMLCMLMASATCMVHRQGQTATACTAGYSTPLWPATTHSSLLCLPPPRHTAAKADAPAPFLKWQPALVDGIPQTRAAALEAVDGVVVPLGSLPMVHATGASSLVELANANHMWLCGTVADGRPLRGHVPCRTWTDQVFMSGLHTCWGTHATQLQPLPAAPRFRAPLLHERPARTGPPHIACDVCAEARRPLALTAGSHCFQIGLCIHWSDCSPWAPLQSTSTSCMTPPTGIYLCVGSACVSQSASKRYSDLQGRQGSRVVGA
jgi:hypothetical protein